MTRMKRIFYIGAFTLLGVLVATLVHAAIEMPLLSVMENQLMTGRSVLADNWWLIHGWGGKLLWVGGAFSGYLAGRRFWRILYVEKRYGTPKW